MSLPATTPTEEQFYNALAPDLKRKVDEIRAQRAGSQEMRDRLAVSCLCHGEKGLATLLTSFLRVFRSFFDAHLLGPGERRRRESCLGRREWDKAQGVNKNNDIPSMYNAQ